MATVTVCVLPWLLGGAIPRARLVLQVGTISAAAFTLLARLLSGRPFATPPVGTLLLLGMASIGILQLQPWMPSAISRMNNSVHPEFREHLPSPVSGSAIQATPDRTPVSSGSAAPAMTRRHVAQWIAVALLLCVVADSLSRTTQLLCMLWLMCINASLMTVLSLLQLFNKGSRWLGEPWMITNKLPFGSFVNQNNASGWLLVHLAMAIGLVVAIWGKNPSSSRSRSLQRPTWRKRIDQFATIARRRMASLNNLQILSLVTVVLVLTGVAATLSRGGIVAGVACLVVCTASRMRARSALLLLVPFLLLMAGASIFLTAIQLDKQVLAELSTLKNPASEAASRVLHWSDSLGSVKDFPILGSGQGAYAWSTRPYLKQGGTAWFVNADNQYVEILVESGFLGLTLFVGFGLWIVVASLQLSRKAVTPSSDHGLWSYRNAIGLAGVALIASQGIAAFCDFGIGLSSTMSAIAVFGGMLAAVRRSQPASSRTATAWYLPMGRLVGVPIRLALVVAAGAAIAELRHEDRIDPAIAASARVLNAPVTREAFEQLPMLNDQLAAALKSYPDHPIVRKSLLNIVEARFRLAVIDRLSPAGLLLDGRPLQDAWGQLTPLALAERVAVVEKSEAPDHLHELRATLSTLAEKFPCQKMAWDIFRQMPLTPGVAVRAAAASSSLGELDDAQLRELSAVRFSDSAGHLTLFQCGIICLIEERPEQTMEFWNQSLEVSERFRIPILVNALRAWSHENALQMFAPEEYATTVRTALARSTPELEAGLFKLAESQWLSVRNNPTREQLIQRAVELTHRESPKEALKWIDSSLVEFPDLSELRPMRAKELEAQGKLDEAIGEWMRYEHFEPTNTQSAKAIKRLKKAQKYVRSIDSP